MLLDDPLLPSPNQLKYKILIKNKKIQRQLNTNTQQFTHQTLSPQTSSTYQQSATTPTKQLSVNNLKIETSIGNDNESKLNDFDKNNLEEVDVDNFKSGSIQVQKSKSFNDSAFNKISALTKAKMNDGISNKKSAKEHRSVIDNVIRRY